MGRIGFVNGGRNFPLSLIDDTNKLTSSFGEWSELERERGRERERERER